MHLQVGIFEFLQVEKRGSARDALIATDTCKHDTEKHSHRYICKHDTEKHVSIDLCYARI
jgi:hypothetical protein